MRGSSSTLKGRIIEVRWERKMMNQRLTWLKIIFLVFICVYGLGNQKGKAPGAGGGKPGTVDEDVSNIQLCIAAEHIG